MVFERKARRRVGGWPQGDIGVILWGLSAVAQEWQSTETVTALCAAGADGVEEPRSGPASLMFAWRVLWPLRWFGLLEHRVLDGMFGVAWRKSVLFERFLSFDVEVKDNRGSGH